MPNKLVQKVELLRPQNGDVIVLRASRALTKEDIPFFTQLRTALSKQGLDDCMILFLPEEFDIEVLDEKQMSAAGWHRKESSDES